MDSIVPDWGVGREKKRVTNKNRCALTKPGARSDYLVLVCFHNPVGLEKQMHFLFQPLWVPDEAPDI